LLHVVVYVPTRLMSHALPSVFEELERPENDRRSRLVKVLSQRQRDPSDLQWRGGASYIGLRGSSPPPVFAPAPPEFLCRVITVSPTILTRCHILRLKSPN